MRKLLSIWMVLAAVCAGAEASVDIWLPRQHIPAFVEPGGSFAAEIRGASNLPTSGWTASISNELRGWTCSVVSATYGSIHQGRENGWRLTVSVPAGAPPELFALTVSNSVGGVTNRVRAVRVVRDFEQSFYILQLTDQHVTNEKAVVPGGNASATYGNGSTDAMRWAAPVINLINPRFVLITGDNNQIYNSATSWCGMTEAQRRIRIYFDALQEYTAPTVLVDGNHDVGWSSYTNSRAVRDNFENMVGQRVFSFRMGSFYVLGNEFTYDEYLPWARADYAAAWTDPSVKYRLIVQHYPADFVAVAYATNPCNLMLVGHTHTTQTYQTTPYPIQVSGTSQDYEKASFYNFERDAAGWTCPQATNHVEGVNVWHLFGDWGSYPVVSAEYTRTNNGTQTSNSVSVVNTLPQDFYAGRVKFLMAHGTYAVEGGDIEAQYDYHNGSNTAVLVKLDILHNATTHVSIEPALSPAGVFSAFTEMPGGIAANAATLNGMVVPYGTNTSAWFEWGTNSSYGNQTPPIDAGNGYQVKWVSAPISGLAPGRIYHCRVTASNNLATVYGCDRIFTAGGRVKAWGDNSYGQTNVPAGLTNAVAVASGLYHGLALRNDGTVVAWGDNDSGQTNVPAGLSGVTGLAAGFGHSVALKADRTVTAWGDDSYEQTNVPSGLTNVVAIAAGAYHTLALKEDGGVVAWGWDQYGQKTVPAGLGNVVEVAATFGDSLALKSDGTVTVWGDDSFGQTNRAAGLTNVVALAAGQFHCLALKADGTVTAWGRNNKGQTNVPVGLNHVQAIACGQNYCLALKSDGSVVTWGDGSSGQTNLPPGLVKVAALSGGLNSGFAIASQLPVAESQAAGGYVNHDLEVTLSGNDPDGNPLGYRITTLPGAGSLYQDAAGSRGDSIATVGALVTDSGGRVIFAPDQNGTGNPYATFGFVANNGEFDSAPAQVLVSINLPDRPLLGQVSWLAGPGGTGSFALNFAGSSNATYSVWASTNLVLWDLIGTALEITPGQYHFVDTSVTNWSEHFYRVSAP